MAPDENQEQRGRNHQLRVNRKPTVRKGVCGRFFQEQVWQTAKGARRALFLQVYFAAVAGCWRAAVSLYQASKSFFSSTIMSARMAKWPAPHNWAQTIS